MVSLQPINLSYFLESESCFDKKIKNYPKDSILNVLQNISPLFLFLIKKANLEEFFISENFDGTVFAPTMEYCLKYQNFFKNINHLQAREIVFSCMLSHKMTTTQLNEEEDIPSLFRYTYIKITNFNTINDSIFILKGNINCSSGIVHITSGLIASSIGEYY